MARTNRVGDDDLLVSMVELVRDTYAETKPVDDGGGLARLEQTLHRQGIFRPRGTTGAPSSSDSVVRRRPLGARPLLGGLLAATATVVLALGGALIYRHFDKVTYEVMNGRIGPGGFVRPTAPGAAIIFSEGSEIVLSETARTRVDSLTTDGGRLVIESGSVHARIVPRKRARWLVEAGPYSIRVTGTAFKVKWSWVDELLDVQMDRGSVVVSGPGAPGGVTLTAGMRLVASRGAGLAISGGAEGSAALEERPAGSPGVEPSPVNSGMPVSGVSDGTATFGEQMRPAARPTRAASPSTAPAARRGTTGASSSPQGLALSGDPWQRQLARGDVEGILTDAEALGIDRVLANVSGRELSALADAARYAHRPALARRVLLAVRDRFPRTTESREAAFFLGALAEDAGGPTSDGSGRSAGSAGWPAALDWYERYLQESRHGRYSPQALGRRMVMTQKMKGSEAARPLAHEYLDRFPGGPYASAARQLMRVP